jgi:transcriptional regulator with XRE-family HTH domain
VRGGEVIKRARTWSDVSVQELADRLGVSESELRAWERADAPFSVVQRAVAACQVDLGLVATLPEPDSADVALLDHTLRLTAEQRLEQMLAYVRFIEAGRAALRTPQ